TSPEVPETRRHLTLQIQNALSGTRKPIILICGPLQTGKTTACLQVISDLMKKGVSPKHIFRLRFDAEFKEIMNSVSLLTWVKWYEKFILDQSFHEVAKKNKKCYLLFDEVQNHF